MPLLVAVQTATVSRELGVVLGNQYVPAPLIVQAQLEISSGIRGARAAIRFECNVHLDALRLESSGELLDHNIHDELIAGIWE
jgi:hypothetical protein